MSRHVALGALITHLTLTSVSHADFGDITLVGQLSIPGAVRITDVWGYVDPVSMKEYALVGDWFLSGFYIIDVSDPALPVLTTTVTGVPGFDIKAWDHYAYVCDGNSQFVDSRVIDLTNIANPTVLPTPFQSCHNIAIRDDGLMFLEFGGLTIYELAGDPANPDSLWSDPGGGHDSTPRGNTLYDFRGTEGLNIWDISDAANPSLVAHDTVGVINYFHSGDVSSNMDYLYVCDELASTPDPDITVYDISNPSSPVQGVTIGDPTSTVHNLYVVGNLAFVSYYTAGFKVFDLTDPSTPVLADTYDTNILTGEANYNAAFGVYPYASSNIVYVSDHPNGLYLFSVEGHHIPPPSAVDGTAHLPGARLFQNYPNPFNPSTTIAFDLARRATVTLRVYDIRGALVRELFEGTLGSGSHQTVWDGRDHSGTPAASGVYYYRLESDGGVATRRMVLLK